MKLFELHETSPQMKSMKKNSDEDALRAELSQAQVDGHPEQVERLQGEVDGLEETAESQYGVFSKGGRIGSINSKPLKTFADKAEAQADAKRRRKGLSQGEREYYGMSYVVRPIKAVQEAGIGDTIKKGVKSVKRGMQGFDNLESMDELKAKVQRMSDDFLKKVLSRSDTSITKQHTVRDDLIKRELRRRGHRDFEKYMPESGMPSSVIKTKERYAIMAQDEPEKLKAHISGLAKLNQYRGKTPYQIALSIQWRHGYGQNNTDGPYAKLFSGEELEETAPFQAYDDDENKLSMKNKGYKTAVLKSLKIGKEKQSFNAKAKAVDPTGKHVKEAEGDSDYHNTTKCTKCGGDTETGYRSQQEVKRCKTCGHEVKRKANESRDTNKDRFDNLGNKFGSKNWSYANKKGNTDGKAYDKDGKVVDPKKVNEAEASSTTREQQQIITRLTNAGGEVYSRATLVKGSEVAILAQNGDRRFAIYPDGTFKPAKKYVEFQVDGWEIEMSMPTSRPKAEKINLKVLASSIEDAVNSTFPDADPFDELQQSGIIQKLENAGVDPMDEMDKAARKFLGAESYNGYLADFWDQHNADNPDANDGNPWR